MFCFFFLFLLLNVNSFYNKFLNHNTIKIKTFYNEQGDLSGDYKLSGLWLLERFKNEGNFDKYINSNPSWSGNKWLSQKRLIITSDYVYLKPNGYFSKLKTNSLHKNTLIGKWYCINSEVYLLINNKATIHTEILSGNYHNNSHFITGNINYGIIDSQYIGVFRMVHMLSNFNPIQKNNLVKTSPIIYTYNTFLGKWYIEFFSNNHFSINVIKLYDDLTWGFISNTNNTNNTINRNNICGNWNIYDNDYDLTTGIKGSGTKLFLWFRKSKYLNLEQDRLYIGSTIEKSTLSNTTNKFPRKVKGDVMVGWDYDPEFIGTFTLKPFY